MATINKTSTNDPFSFKQHLLVDDLTKYTKHFFIGGSANWGDLNGFFRSNVEGIEIHEEGSYSVSEINAWGISDYDLMMEANNILKEEREPFFSIILLLDLNPIDLIASKFPVKIYVSNPIQ